MKNTTVKNYNSDPSLYSVTSLKEWKTRAIGRASCRERV